MMEKPCLEWTGARTAGGYGVTRINGTLLYVHRIAYEAKHGKIPTGLVIDHRCRNRACFEDSHMDVVTSAENTRRGGNAIKTHCNRNHPFDEKNTRVRKGKRYCRRCAADRIARIRAELNR